LGYPLVGNTVDENRLVVLIRCVQTTSSVLEALYLGTALGEDVPESLPARFGEFVVLELFFGVDVS